MLDLYLKQLGFSEKEVLILTCLAEHGEISPAVIASTTNIPRSTVYTVLETFSRDGLIQIAHRQGGAMYSLGSSAAFSARVEREREQVTVREKTVKELASLLEPVLTDPRTGLPKIRFFSGKKSIEKMLMERRALWRHSMHLHDKTWWGYQDDAFVNQYRPWFDDTWKTTPADELVKLISNKSPLEETLEGQVINRDIKQVLGPDVFSSTIWVCGDFVILITTRAKPHYAFELQDAVFGSNLRALFGLLWAKG